MLDMIKGVVGAVAPTLGTALGGPLGGAAASMIADALGCDNDEKSINKALQSATPDELAMVKEADPNSMPR